MFPAYEIDAPFSKLNTTEVKRILPFTETNDTSLGILLKFCGKVQIHVVLGLGTGLPGEASQDPQGKRLTPIFFAPQECPGYHTLNTCKPRATFTQDTAPSCRTGWGALRQGWCLVHPRIQS